MTTDLIENLSLCTPIRRALSEEGYQTPTAVQLAHRGISAGAIHSNKSQNARQRALWAFERGSVRVLVATDIVARGIDVDGISHVINYELPFDPESYVHRIGRTARAGAAGVSRSFCDAEEVRMLKGIEKLTNSPLTTMDDHPFHSTAVAALRHEKLRSPRPSSSRQQAQAGRRRFKPKGRRLGGRMAR